MNWYNKQGEKISVDRSEELLKKEDYKIIKQEELPSGKIVSTVWLGLDHGFDGDTPIIFETMVFPGDGDWLDEDCERYSTLEGAKKGHNKMVKKWLDK